ncbi:MAG: T9SS type A sorting domain-containing protein [Bacteroidota bacterium]|nr:T9SS type A sorting domain-containing protein [Bacteroidota bacterium]
MKRILLLTILLVVYRGYAQIDTLPVTGPTWGGSSKLQDMLIDNTGNYWLTYSNTNATLSGVKRYDGANWILYQTSNSGLPSNRVNTVIQDVNNNYWLGTNAGLAKFDGTNWTVYNKANSGICSDTIYVIKESGSNLWLGTNNGLSKFDGSNWTTFNNQNSGLNNNIINSLESDGTNLYIGTTNGLSILNNSVVQNYPHNFQVGNITSSIKLTSDYGIVIATSKGVFMFNNGTYTILEDYFDFCSVQNFIFSTTEKRKYIETNSFNGIVVNYGGYIREFNGSASADLILGSVKGLLKRKNGKYFVLAYSGSQLCILSIDEINNPNAFVPLAQSITNCYTEKLNINQVSAPMLDRGDMFGDLNNNDGYEVPKGSGSYVAFAGSIWIGGRVGTNLRTACQTYRQSGTDFWPGPLDTVTAQNPNDTGSLGNIMKVNRFDVQNFIFNYNNGNVQSGNFMPSRGILNWPAHGTGNFSRNTAPFIDVNLNGLYDPLTGGDYPDIKGDQMLYHIYNDASGNHLESGSLNPLRLEIRQKSYAYTCEGIADSLKALNYTTFYEFEIINRSDDIIDSMYIAYWNDSDLGFYNDDYVGCNVKENYGYIYNGDNYDEDGSGIGYKNYLPCFATAIVEGPVADIGDGTDNDHDGIVDEPGEQLGMSSFLNYYNDFSNMGNPSQQIHYYNYMRGNWKDGSAIKYGGNGTSGTIATKYQYPGNTDPIGYGVGGSPSNPMPQPTWTEATAGNLPGDRRLIVGSGPFTLQAKDTTKIVYAMVFTQDSANPFASIVKNEQDVKRIKAWYNNKNFPSCLDLSTISIKENKTGKLNYSLYPNPATNAFTLVTDQLNGDNTIEIFDIVGKRVMTENITSNKQVFSIADLASGIYIVKINDKYTPVSCKLIKQ